MSEKEKFELMLETDKKTFETLASIELFLKSPKATSSPNYAAVKKSYDQVLARYNARQIDYKTNTLYKLGNAIADYADKTTTWFKDQLSKVGSWFGLGAAPLVVPVAIVAGSALTLTAVAYFVYRYNSQTVTDYNQAFETLALVAKDNPALADKMLSQLSEIKRGEQNTGFFNQLGQGGKIAIAAGGTGILLFAGYKIAQAQGWIR